MNSTRVRRRDFLAYGALGLPLAFAALPLYVHVPRLYAELGLSLATIGVVLLAARIVDAVTDPLIGWAIDRMPDRRRWVALALPVLGLGLFVLLAPPSGIGAAGLLILLVIVSLGYSVATIAYNAWGAEVATTAVSRTQFVASREAFGLVGVVLAAALPALLAGGQGEAVGLARLGIVFLPLLVLLGGWTLWRSPRSAGGRPSRRPVLAGLGAAMRVPGFAHLLAVFAVNGIAAAVPSATVLFFVADVLEASAQAGLFLVLYFVAAAVSLPLWVAVSRCIGKSRSWLAGMVLAVAVFGWAANIAAGDVLAYGVICVLSGVALGADLSLPTSILADLLAPVRGGEDTDAASSAVAAPTSLAGACFGWWNFVTKANLALAAGLALPLLAGLGYAPGVRTPDALAALSIVYAVLPVVLKLGAIVLLWRWHLLLETASIAQQTTAARAPCGVCES